MQDSGGLQKHLLKQIKGLPYEEVLRKELKIAGITTTLRP